jgi:group I intron endonuclease
MTYLYALIDPLTNECRYVGKADDPKRRLKNHLGHIKRDVGHKVNWIKALRATGSKPEMVILEQVPKIHFAEAEQWWISYFRYLGANLTNITIGGDGASGYIHTESAKRRIGDAHRGKRYSDAIRLKMSTAAKGRIQSAESNIKRSKSLKGKVLSAENKALLLAANIGRPYSNKTRKAVAESNRRRRKEPKLKIYKDPELTRQKLSIANMGHAVSEGTRIAVANANKNRIWSEESKLKIANANRQRAAAKHGIKIL